MSLAFGFISEGIYQSKIELQWKNYISMNVNVEKKYRDSLGKQGAAITKIYL